MSTGSQIEEVARREILRYKRYLLYADRQRLERGELAPVARKLVRKARFAGAAMAVLA